MNSRREFMDTISGQMRKTDFSDAPKIRSYGNTFIAKKNEMGGTGLTLPGNGCSCGKCQQCGAGLVSAVKLLLDKGKKVGSAISSAYSSEVGTMARNALPDSDINARPGFAGEKHAILKLSNGKYGVANYMGPGTQIEARLRRDDPPRTMSDKVAMSHDIRYTLATSQKDVGKADKIMINKLKNILKNREDSSFNVNMGLRPIQAKYLAERAGIFKPGQIAEYGGATPENMDLLKGKLNELEQEGFGMKPAEMLKKKLMRNMKRGKGITLPGGAFKDILKKISHFTANTALPFLIKKLKGEGLKLAGQGGMGAKLSPILYMHMLKGLNNGASRDKLSNSNDYMVGNGIMPSKETILRISKSAGEILLPLLLKMAQKKMMGGSFEELKRRAENPSLLDKLSIALATVVEKKIKSLLKGKIGSGMIGGSFWHDFVKGFKMVFKPGAKILGGVASALGMPEFGIPLSAASSLL